MTPAGTAAVVSREVMRNLVSRRLDDLHQEVASDDTVVLAVPVQDARDAAGLLDALVVLRDATSQQRATAGQVLAALLPPGLSRAGRGTAVQAQRNAVAQLALADEFGLLTSAQVAQRAGSVAANAAALASRWRREGQIFAVPIDASVRYPGFQFDDNGRPLPVIEAVLLALHPALSSWDIALWFTSGNGWLGDERPVDVLTSDQKPVENAARRLAEELAA